MERATEERVALLLEVVLSPRGRVHRTTSPPENLVDHDGVDLLDVVDLALQIQGTITHRPVKPDGVVKGRGLQVVEVEPVSTAPLHRLDRLLDDGGSVYRVNRRLHPPRLTRRVDPSADAALDRALDTAEQTVSELLARAWTKTYSRNTDPDGAYFDALRAVERLACPLVLPKNGRASLNDVAKHLSSPGGGAKWELVLTKLGDGSVEPVVAMFDRLWHGNLKSRHGSLDYREVTLDEARAGVQLAVLLVQWLTDDVLRPRSSPRSS